MRIPSSSGVGPLLALAVIAITLLPPVRGDPSITVGGQGSLNVEWNFRNPANYSLSGAAIQGGKLSLRMSNAWWNSTTRADFASYSSATNIDLNGKPGKVLLNNTAFGLSASYTSKVGGNGTSVLWKSIGWNASFLDDLSDDFSAPSLSTRWTWFNPPASYDLTSRPGWLTSSSRLNTDFWNAQNNGHFLYLPITGDFQVEARMQTSPLTLASQKAGILIMADANNWGTIHRLYSGGVRLRAVTTIFGSSTVNNIALLSPEYLMVRRTGSVLETYYSSDGRNWIFFSNLGISVLPATLLIGVMVADGNSGTSVTMQVDYIHFSFASANPQATIQTRVGNATDTADPSWTSWSSAYLFPNGSAINRPARYLQFRILLSTASVYVRPFVGDVLIASIYFPTRGQALTEDFRPGAVKVWELMAVVADLQRGTLNVSYSFDAGRNWTGIVPGPLNLTVSGTIRLRLALATPDTSKSPTISFASIVLRAPPEVPPGPPIPWGLIGVLVLIGLAPIPPVLYMRRPQVEDVFLVQKDGILVAHVSHGDTLEKDQDNLAGTLTVIQSFVSEAFTYGKGQRLHRMEMGEYQVALETGSKAYLAVVYSGRGRLLLSFKMRRILRGIEADFGRFLEPWTGNMDVFAVVPDRLKPLLGRRKGAQSSAGPEDENPTPPTGPQL